MLPDILPGTAPQPQRVLVTSGASGIGLAVAKKFHESGAKVHIADGSAEGMVQTLADHPGMHGTVIDVAEPEDVSVLVSEANQWMSGIDVLVNCAMEVGPRVCLDQLSPEEWNRVVSVNLSGMFYCIREVAASMKEQLGGAIINLGSHAASSGLPKRVAYVASKAGVLGLTQNVAREFGPFNIRCNAVLPGMMANQAGRQLVETRARAKRLSLEEAEAELLQHVSMRTWIEPEEVAEVVFFLASDGAKHVCGQALGVCGNLEWE